MDKKSINLLKNLPASSLLKLTERMAAMIDSEKLSSMINDVQSSQDTNLITRQDKKKIKLENIKNKHSSNFDINSFRQRHIAFQVQYDGSKYAGFASQDSEETIESHLFASFKKLNLIKDEKSCLYSRCGRTDKGVSAMGQVIALQVRSAIPLSVPDNLLPSHPRDPVCVKQIKKIKPNRSESMNEESGKVESIEEIEIEEERIVYEIDYCTLLNKNLPDDIRIIGWTPVTDKFSARFSATSRTYRYFFLKKKRNIEAMQEAAKLLVGSHDYRNICKLDIVNVKNFEREIFYAKIIKYSDIKASNYQNFDDFRVEVVGGEELYHSELNKKDDDNVVEDENTLYILEISGVAFLWHMVRCIMALLFSVGDNNEDPSIITSLLDIKTNPSKPAYMMAEDIPLVLHYCGYENLHFSYTPRSLWYLHEHYMKILNEKLISVGKIENSLNFIKECMIRKNDYNEFFKEILLNYEKNYQRAINKNLLDSDSLNKFLIDQEKFKNIRDKLSQENELLDEDNFQVNKKIKLSWGEALEEIEKISGLSPTTSTTPYTKLLNVNISFYFFLLLNYFLFILF